MHDLIKIHMQTIYIYIYIYIILKLNYKIDSKNIRTKIILSYIKNAYYVNQSCYRNPSTETSL